jgi:hypothetical protein
MLLGVFCANTVDPLYRFLHTTTIRIQIGSKYNGLVKKREH